MAISVYVRLMFSLAVTFFSFGMMETQASAITLTQKGAAATLTGRIDAGDDVRLRQFLRRPEAAQVRVLYLASPGGYIYEAYKMSETIRAANLTTIVDASRGMCASACTALFVGGVKRYYLNAQTIVDGQPARRGLGFHSARDWSGGTFHTEVEASSIGNGALAYVYREMGVPGASALLDRAGYHGMYWLSAKTALQLGIATGLSGP